MRLWNIHEYVTHRPGCSLEVVVTYLELEEIPAYAYFAREGALRIARMIPAWKVPFCKIPGYTMEDAFYDYIVAPIRSHSWDVSNVLEKRLSRLETEELEEARLFERTENAA